MKTIKNYLGVFLQFVGVTLYVCSEFFLVLGTDLIESAEYDGREL